MSKFANFMHLLDVKNAKIVKKEFRGTTRPLEEQQECVIPIILPKLNTECEKCVHCDVVWTEGKVDEMGIGGIMSNLGFTDKDVVNQEGMKPVKNNPAAGITVRKPRAIIKAAGNMFICRNRLRKASTVFIAENETVCSDFKAKAKPKI